MADLRRVSGPERDAEQSIGYRSGAPRSGSEERRGRNSFPGPREALGDFVQVSSLHSGDLQVISVRFFHVYNRTYLLLASLWL